MKVILTSDIETLGKLGAIVEVKPGYARNYLFPRDMALKPTPHNLDLMEKRKKKVQQKLEIDKLSAMDQKQKIEEITLTIEKKAGEKDTLFGSVTPMEIEKLLEETGVHIERKKLHLEEPIKRLGSYTCKVKLMEDVEAEFKIEVVKEGGEESPEPEPEPEVEPKPEAEVEPEAEAEAEPEPEAEPEAEPKPEPEPEPEAEPKPEPEPE
ncbi:MAG: 50S ribosomal protein L9 [Candidatus Aminicenantes bacterium]|nr:50S ribosomal protein L9 [Candidatus Aminicenantes bacterium]